MEEILKTDDFNVEQEDLDYMLGNNDVYFLPYLMGERSPHNDVNARGCFIGMRPDTSRKQMTLAVMEGVAFALLDCVEVAKKSGLKITSSKICGGGAKSDIWKKIIANVFGVPLYMPNVEEGPAYGASILAMVGAGEYNSVQDAVEQIVGIKEKIEPKKELVELYAKRYQSFIKLYPALKRCFVENF
jgi:xylulokinase